MSHPLHPICGGIPVPAAESSETAVDALFDALASRRRREILSVLADRRGPVSEADLVSHVVAREEAKPLRAVGDEEHQRVYVSLHHAHLPKLADAGLITRDDGRHENRSDDQDGGCDDTRRCGRSVAATSHPLFVAPEFDAVLRRAETDPDATDAALSALADERRRSMLAVLADAGSLTGTELAERVARRANDALGDSDDEITPDDEIARTLASFRHVHLPVLARAGLVTYDAEERVVTYEGHPAIEDHWFDRPFGRSSPATIGRDGDAWTLDGRENVVARSRRVCESADDRLFVVVPSDDELGEACLACLRDAAERGVDVSVGARSAAVRSLVAERVPDATVWEPRLDPVSGGETLGRIALADGESVVLGSLAAEDADDPRAETGITGEGETNPLVALVGRLLGLQRDGQTEIVSDEVFG